MLAGITAGAISVPAQILVPTMAIAANNTGTSTGIVDTTNSLLAGETPKAAFIIGSFHEVANDPGETSHAGIAIGFTDGANNSSISSISQDNVANTNVSKTGFSNNGYCLRGSGGGSTIKLAAASLITEGLELNFSTNSGNSMRFATALFAGPSMQALVGTSDLGTGAGTHSVSLGFEPDIVLTFDANQNLDGSSESLHRIQFGIAVNDGSDTQRCVSQAETDGIATGRPFLLLSSTAAIHAIAHASGASVAKATIGNFSSSGFDYVTDASFGGSDAGWLALDLGGKQFALVDFDTPTSTGDFSITGAGFKPSTAIAVVTSLETVDDFPGSTSDLQSGFAICLIADDEWSTGIRIDSGAATTDTASEASNSAMIGPSATDCDAFKASFVSWDSDGATFNASAIHGTARKGFILFVE